MGTLLDLADGADAQLLQGLVVEFAAVVLAHAWTRPDRHHKVKLLMNGLVTRAYRCANRRFPRSRPTVGVEVKCSPGVQLSVLFYRLGSGRYRAHRSRLNARRPPRIARPTCVHPPRMPCHWLRQ